MHIVRTEIGRVRESMGFTRGGSPYAKLKLGVTGQLIKFLDSLNEKISFDIKGDNNVILYETGLEWDHMTVNLVKSAKLESHIKEDPVVISINLKEGLDIFYSIEFPDELVTFENNRLFLVYERTSFIEMIYDTGRLAWHSERIMYPQFKDVVSDIVEENIDYYIGKLRVSILNDSVLKKLDAYFKEEEKKDDPKFPIRIMKEFDYYYENFKKSDLKRVLTRFFSDGKPLTKSWIDRRYVGILSEIIFEPVVDLVKRSLTDGTFMNKLKKFPKLRNAALEGRKPIKERSLKENLADYEKALELISSRGFTVVSSKIQVKNMSIAIGIRRGRRPFMLYKGGRIRIKDASHDMHYDPMKTYVEMAEWLMTELSKDKTI